MRLINKGGEGAMMITKKCCICGYEFAFDNELRTNLYISKKNSGATGYFNLWHYFVEQCPHCGYASQDISRTQNKSIVKSKSYKLDNPDIIEKLDEARPNMVSTYLMAEKYYDSIDDEVNRAKCLFQAADLVYAEIMYWEEYIFDGVGNDLRKDMQYVQFETFAEELYDKGLKVLAEHIKEHPEDIDSRILHAGICSDGSSVQKIQGISELRALEKDTKLTTLQRDMVEYLLKDL